MEFESYVSMNECTFVHYIYKGICVLYVCMHEMRVMQTDVLLFKYLFRHVSTMYECIYA